MAKELNRVQQKAQKKKITILGVMVLLTGITWSRTLFGKGDKPTANTTNASSTAPSAAPQAIRHSISIPETGNIQTYSQAVALMELWPKALHRKMHAGTIEELTPINDLLGEKAVPPTTQDEKLPIQAPSPLETNPEMGAPKIDFKDLRLRLTTTAHFGNASYAVISGERVRTGQTVLVQVGEETVRYEVRAIGMRMVELSFGNSTYTLQIELPDLQRRDQDGA